MPALCPWFCPCPCPCARKLHQAGIVELQVHRQLLRRPEDVRHVGHDLLARIVDQRILRHQFLAVLGARDLLLHRLHLVAQDHRTQAQRVPRAQIRNHKRRFERAGLALAVLARHELQAVLARPERKPGVVLDLLARDFAGGGRSHLQRGSCRAPPKPAARGRRESRR